MFGIAVFTYVMGIGIAILAGLLVRYVLRRLNSSYQINWKEFGVGVAVLAVVVTPGVSWAGTEIAHANAVGGYVEYLNGSITAAKSEEINCTRDGSCHHTYDCDLYFVSVGSGKRRHLEPRWHHCPYTTKEYRYWLDDSFGGHHPIGGETVFDANPQQWRGGKSIPGDIAKGVPAAWQEAKSQIESGNAPPATAEHEYVNYYLVSQSTILKTYGGDIPGYRQRSLLAPHTVNYKNGIIDGYMAKKVVTAGNLKLNNEDEWQKTLARLNAKLGGTSTLRGDLHMLVVPAALVGEGEADSYANAMLAYWQSDEFGKNGLAKNAIALIVGVDDAQTTVTWARAKTGLPVGNGELMANLSLRLRNAAFEPSSLLGSPTAKIVDGNPVYDSTSGLVDQIITRDFPYQRPCMDCKDKGEAGGYVYLDSETLISGWAQFWIVLAGVLLAGGIWWFFAYMPFFEGIHPGRRAQRNRFDY